MPTSRETVIYQVKLEGTQQFKREARQTAIATQEMKAAARSATIPIGGAAGMGEKDLALMRRMSALQATAGAAQVRAAQKVAALDAQIAASAAKSRGGGGFRTTGFAVARAGGLGRFSALAGGFGGLGPVGIGVAGAALTAGMLLKAGIANAALNQQLTAQTNAAIKSTGGAANVTAKQVDTLSVSLGKLSGVSDESVHDAENILLTFTGIRNEVGKDNKIFDEASLAVQDISARMHIDASQSALQLGKALNDPVRGVGALRREGVQFTHAQEDQIKVLMASGRRLAAQKIIIHEVTTEFGGSAEAAGKTLPGALTNLKESFETNVTVPLTEHVTPALATFIDQLTKDLPGAAKTAGDALKQLDPTSTGPVRRWLRSLPGGKAADQPLFPHLVKLTHALSVGGGALGGALHDPLRGLLGQGTPADVRRAQLAQAAKYGEPSDWIPRDGYPKGKGLGAATPFRQNDVTVHWDNPYPLEQRPIELIVDGKVLASTVNKRNQKQAHAQGRGSAHKP